MGLYACYQKIDKAFMNIPMAEARDFHCFSHVFENLGKRSIPRDHAAVRMVFSKTDCSGTPRQTHSELDVQTSRFLFCFETDQ